MKRIYFILFWAVMLIASCSGKAEAPGGDNTPLAVSPLSVEVIALGEQKSFSVTSSVDWLVRSSQNWLKVQKAKGTPDEHSFSVLAEENKTTDPRSAQLTVSNLNGESKQITVTQAAGTGSEDVRGISNAEDLVGLSKAIRGEEGYSIANYLVDGVIKFNKDIDASSIIEWIPIGTSEYPLTYSIDGNNKSITGINWQVDATKYMNVGLVGVGNGITISRLTFGNTGSKVSFKLSGTGKVRAGGIIGRAQGVTLDKVTNKAALSVEGTAVSGNDLIIGGLAGYSDGNSLIGGEIESRNGCKSLGDITVPVAAQAGGLVGHNSGSIRNCTFEASITGPVSGSYGPAWICSYGLPSAKGNVSDNYGAGKVNGVACAVNNAMMNVTEAYNPETNTVDWSQDDYYAWTEKERVQLHSGAIYHHYVCTNVPREIYVIEVDLTDPGIEITAVIADESIPNPNGLKHNDYNYTLNTVRERLSDICKRRRSEGEKILAGVNSGFFDTTPGILRGFHVEEGQPAYINNPSVVNKLPNHNWAFTVFTDGTASCGKKSFSGKMCLDGTEYNYYSLNDTILRHTSADYQANLYNVRYKKQPHKADHPELVNELASNAMYVVCEWDSEPMKVNTGYASATVKEIRDGRTGSITPPYITASNRFAIALSGEMAGQWKSKVAVGSKVEVKCDISVEGSSNKPIYAQVSTMYQLMTDGADASNTPGSSASLYSKYDPMTYPVVSKDFKKVWLVEIDGRQLWYSMGVKGYEMYQIAKKLGGAWVTRFDGGGSSSIWVWDQAKGSGSIRSKPSDSPGGERSCISYILVREKQ